MSDPFHETGAHETAGKDEAQPSIVELTERLIAFDTTSRESNLALIDFVADFLKGYGIESERVPSPDGAKANLYATIGPRDRGGVLLSGHTDVVPVDGQPWTSDPFRVVERDGRLYGRGTADMKGFLAAVLSRVPALASAPLIDPVHLAFTYDEELGCLGAPDLVEFIRHQPVRPRLAVVGEPTGMKVVVAHKGMYVYATHITGREAHSSTPHLGANAVLAASRIVAFLADLERELRDKAAERSAAAGELAFDPPYTTITATVLGGGTAVNIVPREASLNWGVRLMPGMTPEDILKPLDAFIAETVLPELRATAPDAAIETKASAVVPPLVPELDSEAERLALALTGGNATHAVPFATEGGLYQSLGVPTVICGPGSIEQAHKADEFVAVSQLDACGAFLDKLKTWLVDGLDAHLGRGANTAPDRPGGDGNDGN